MDFAWDAKSTLDEDDLLPEYNLDYSKAKPNHYAARLKRNTIVLDDDVANVLQRLKR